MSDRFWNTFLKGIPVLVFLNTTVFLFALLAIPLVNTRTGFEDGIKLIVGITVGTPLAVGAFILVCYMLGLLVEFVQWIFR